jgi:CheY-like chemotaxis protein
MLVPRLALGPPLGIHSASTQTIQQEREDVKNWIYSSLGVVATSAQYDRAIIDKHLQALAHNEGRQRQEKSLETGIPSAKTSSTNMVLSSQIKNRNRDRARRIMIVDDEQDVTFLFKIILESTQENGSYSCKVDSFNDSMIALEKYREGQYDLIMIDIVMPKMDGFKLYKEIRKQDKKVKVCFLTAGEMYYEEYRKHAFPEISADRIIRKPISNDDLLRKVNSLFDA